jgi:uncharacterized membrane protein YphA (DoxX/SURF4 family)
MRRVRSRALDALAVALRLGLAAVWLVSGFRKLVDPGQTYVAVQAYDLLPGAAVGPVATALPLVELALGLLLLIGWRVRAAAALSAVLLAAFVVGIAQAWARGLAIDCGCFGSGGPVAEGETDYPRQIALDVALLAAAIWLAVRPATRLSVDRWLGGGGASPPGEADNAGMARV